MSRQWLFWVLGIMAVNLLRPRSYGGQSAPYTMTMPQKPKPKTPKAVLVTRSLEEWLRPEGMSYQALHLPRKMNWPNYQTEIDRSIAAFGPDCQVERKVLRESGNHLDFQHAAEDLLCSLPLPKDLIEVVKADACELGKTLAALCPRSKVFLLKLELMGEYVCPRWHRDMYCGRGIISYNLAGTQYLAEEHADIWELENCGNNDCILKDKSKVQQVNVGDIFFMKGRGFPTGEKGLVHKSPPEQRHPDGGVMNRLVLKVDIPMDS